MPGPLILEVPWQSDEDFFSKIKRHWPHYTNLSLYYHLEWEADKIVTFPAVREVSPGEENNDPPGHVECPLTTRNDKSTGSYTKTFSWTRQSEADEISDQPPAEGEFNMGIDIVAHPSSSPMMDSVFFHQIGQVGTSGTSTGTQSQTLHGGNACHVTVETTVPHSAASIITGGTPSFSEIGVYESGNAWAKSACNAGVGLTFGTSPPFTIPTIPDTAVTALGGSPQGAAIVFTNDITVTVLEANAAGGWYGTIKATFTVTIS